MDIYLILMIFACLLLSAFFSGMEIAFISTNNVFVEIDTHDASYLYLIFGCRCVALFAVYPNPGIDG